MTEPTTPGGKQGPSSLESEDAEQCSICGSTEQLRPDTQLEDVYYCGRCWERARRQQQAIDEGYEVNPDVEM
ncbi:hypothetical protein H8D51_04280 [bacterium]|nr:hypothetical protein [bacterium]